MRLVVGYIALLEGTGMPSVLGTMGINKPREVVPSRVPRIRAGG